MHSGGARTRRSTPSAGAGPDGPDVLTSLGILGHQEVAVSERLRHLEIYTWEGLLTVLWHGDPKADRVVIACGGALGGSLGPAGLYHELGERFPDQGIATLRVGYRRSRTTSTPACVDLLAAAQLAGQDGGQPRSSRWATPSAARWPSRPGALWGATAGRRHARHPVGRLRAGRGRSRGARCPCSYPRRPDDDPPVLRQPDGADDAGGELVILPGANHRLTRPPTRSATASAPGCRTVPVDARSHGLRPGAARARDARRPDRSVAQ